MKNLFAPLFSAFLACASLAADAPPPSRAPADPAKAPPAVLGDLADYFAEDAPYRPASGEDRLAVALGISPSLQFGGPNTDVALLRLALAARHHNVSGLDIALLFGRTRGAATGVQFSLANAVAGPMRGAQIALAANVAGLAPESPGAGVQAAIGVNWADAFSGIQFAAALNRSARGRGAQVAVFSNLSDDFSGVQVAAVNMRGTSFSGVQIGLVNTGADSVEGLQIGVYNGAARFRGVQIGLVNCCETSEYPFLPFLRVSL
ncbi:MAG: hypothetical protein IJS46_00845 [Kiritimatiellae bacterium]|nr:hypothetical protein [Kiritimatiellia bacterium]